MRVKTEELERWRTVSPETVMHRIAAYAKRDSSYAPRLSDQTSRWHAVIEGREFEVLFTGVRFWDGRAAKGGGGAIDFVMHTTRLRFREAIELLRGHGF